MELGLVEGLLANGNTKIWTAEDENVICIELIFDGPEYYAGYFHIGISYKDRSEETIYPKNFCAVKIFQKSR